MTSLPGIAVGLFWVPGHAGLRGNEIADGVARGGSVMGFLGPEPALGASRREIQKRLSRCLFNQHWDRWRGLDDTPRQAREFISGPSPGAKEKFLSFNRIHARAVTGLLTGHNTLRIHHLLGLANSPTCRRCGIEEETSAHILCECEALASSRYVHRGSLFLEPQDIQRISLGAIRDFSKVMGLP